MRTVEEKAELLSQFQLEEKIHDLRQKAKSQQPHWNAMKGLYIDGGQQKKLLAYVDASDKASLMEKDGEFYAKIFVSLFSKLETYDYRTYILTMIEEAIDAHPDAIRFFLALSIENPKFPLDPFVSALREDTGKDLYFSYAITRILCLFMCKSSTTDTDMAKSVVDKLLANLKDQKEKRVPILGLKLLLKKPEYRKVFVDCGGLSNLSTILSKEYEEYETLQSWAPPELAVEGEIREPKPPGPNIQLIYESMYCLWLVSFQEDLATSFTGLNLIRNLVNLIKSIPKDKIKRIGISILRNLSSSSDVSVEMIVAGFHNVLRSLSVRKWGDPELQEDIEKLGETVESNVLSLNSFDKYAAEVHSSKLLWTTPSHKSEKFWKQNAERFESEDCKVLKKLIDLLASPDTDTVAIALHDIGEFARHHPRGKAILTRLEGAKSTIMGLMTSEDPKIATNALLCVQKLVVTNWEFLSR